MEKFVQVAHRNGKVFSISFVHITVKDKMHRVTYLLFICSRPMVKSVSKNTLLASGFLSVKSTPHSFLKTDIS